MKTICITCKADCHNAGTISRIVDCSQYKPGRILTNADRTRTMSDEELAEFINRCTSGEDAPRFCRRLPECDADLETDTLIPLERCGACLLHWLKQPAKEDT